MDEGWIDLHTHTTASDGSLTPTQLVEAAVTVGLRAVAVTDHDTSDGVPEALEAGTRLGIRVVPGIEISAQLAGGTLHVLGYEIDQHETRFAAGIAHLKQARADRNPKIIQKLQEMGIPISLEQVEEKSGGDLIGRPHIAETLVDLGAVRTAQEAFDRYLGSDAKAYVHKYRLEPGAAFELISGAGGIPVMAHPYQTRREGEDLRRLVANLKELGLAGIEIYYTNHTPAQTAYYQELSQEFDLVPTGGTDFHGKINQEIVLGWGRGELRVPARLLEEIDRRVAGVRTA